MNRKSINRISNALIAAVLLTTAALSGCASVSDDSFFYVGEDVVPHDNMQGA